MEKHKITQKITIKDLPTLEIVPNAKKQLKKLRKGISKDQDKMYAHGKYAMLICIQGMDTSGKDSLIREIFKDVNARGVVVHSFKVPTEKELKHDYLWRHYIALPERGKINVFNRTHYENVLVTRVHKEYVLHENIPTVSSVNDLTDAFYFKRMEDINAFEKHLSDNGTIVLKFFLNISKEEQKRRLLRRLELPEKQWKFSAGDLKERKLWDDYMNCYEDVLNNTSTSYAPWYMIPADDKPSARALVANIIAQHILKHKDIKYPELDAKDKDDLQLFIQELQNENS
ncbi:MAG TPA: polyphosphate kinase 2 family protein [Flavobacteriia bacterium]|nr:polyphosphate kinase 2 family protein [Flavobacteriia bacterium]